ncbi:hypothetical protein R1sor_022707 [Riccia sorocarpa]|uniref:Uncharacterized protein n=1 Tax=Riccia sorocarpa TaxID=122646 RepID=A0ABD3GPH6_9MARC
MAGKLAFFVAMVVTAVASAAAVNSDSVAEILKENGLPPGLLPGSVKEYTLGGNGRFKVELFKECYAKVGEDNVYYSPTITGDVSLGQIKNLVGIQAKEGWFWFSVTGIVANSKTITFQVGPISKDLSIDVFDSPPVCNSKATGQTFSEWFSKVLDGDVEMNVSSVLEETLPRKMLQ